MRYRRQRTHNSNEETVIITPKWVNSNRPFAVSALAVSLFVFASLWGQDLGIGKRNSLRNDAYYEFLGTKEGRFILVWGNPEFADTVSYGFDSLNVWHCCEVVMESQGYVNLSYGTGSGTWTDLILPLKKSAREISYQNGLALDLGRELIIYESWGSADSELIAENFVTHKKIVFGKNYESCQSAFKDYCIDSLSFRNGVLKFDWEPFLRHDENNRNDFKKYSVKINCDGIATHSKTK